MPFNIENKDQVDLNPSLTVPDLNVDVSGENSPSMRAKFETLLWRVSSLIDQKQEQFLKEILEHKDRLWFWREVWRCMMEVEYFIEGNSRNKAMCIAYIDQDLNLEKIDFSNQESIMAS